MNHPYWHLLINDLPLTGILFGMIILIIGILLKNPSVKRIALSFFIFSTIVTIPAYYTGKRTLEAIGNLEGIDKNMINIHRQAATEFILFSTLLGIISLITLFLDLTNKKLAQLFYIVLIATALFTSFLTQDMASSGRQIRHTEISPRRVDVPIKKQ
jgi:hypothetical protein